MTAASVPSGSGGGAAAATTPDSSTAPPAPAVAAAPASAAAPAPLPSPSAAAAPPTAAPAALQNYGQLPLHFEANQGQLDPQVAYFGRGPGYNLFITQTGQAVLDVHQTTTAADGTTQLSGDVVTMTLAGASATPQVVGLQPLGGTTNYFLGSDPTQWVTNVPTYAQVEVRNVYPGINLDFHAAAANAQQLEYDFSVQPGADPSQIQLHFDGAQGLTSDGQGGLILQTPGGTLDEQAPVLYQPDTSGNPQPVGGSFTVQADGQVGFQVGAYNSAQPLVIDPVSYYSTFLGGSQMDQATADALDGSNNLYVVGDTTSLAFPTTVGAYNRTFHGSSGNMIVVSKLNPAGTGLVYSTYLGGWAQADAYGIAVDTSGDAFVAGDTGTGGTSNYPTTAGGFQTSWATGATTMGVLTELNPTGSSLVYSTLYGGNNVTSARALALDTSGNALIAGLSSSTNLPLANAAQATYGGGAYDAFLAKFNSAGTSLTYGTYLGAGGDDEAYGLALDGSGNAYVTGTTTSTGLATAGVFQVTQGGGTDAFVASYTSAGVRSWLTYLGGSGSDAGNAIALDGLGNIYVTGNTSSSNFPVLNPLQSGNGGGQDAFLSELNNSGTALLFGSYLGGSGTDASNALAVTRTGDVLVAGSTSSSNFPVVNALQATLAGTTNAFLARVAAGGTAVLSATYWGGMANDRATGLALDTAGMAYLVGAATSSNFPTSAGAYQASYGGGSDAFVSKLSAFGLPALTPPDLIGGTPADEDLVSTATGATGGNPGGSVFSPYAPVRYVDGAVSIRSADLSSSGFGSPWGVLRSWTNQLALSGSTVTGNGWMVGQLPYLLSNIGQTTVPLPEMIAVF
jgi:hypothetical protein